MSDPIPVIYIAGPYRAKTPFQILGNIRRAQEVALDVWRLGAVALCPHANTTLFDGEADDAIWLLGDQELLRRSDAILMVEGWMYSAGARDERQLAFDLGLPIFDTWRELDVLKEWIDCWKQVRLAESGEDLPQEIPNLSEPLSGRLERREQAGDGPEEGEREQD